MATPFFMRCTLGLAGAIALGCPIAAKQTGNLDTALTPPAYAAGTIEQGKRQVAAGDLAGAEITARHAVETQPASADALYLLGEVLMRRNQPAASLEVLTRAATRSPPTGEQLRIVGLDYVLLDDTADAIRWLNRAAEETPSSAEIWYSLGRAQFTRGSFAAAEASFRHALQLNAASAKAEDNLGLALSAQNNTEAALEAFTRATQLDTQSQNHSEQPYLNRGTLLLHLGRSQEAIENLAQAVKLAPKCGSCHEVFGQTLLALKRLPEARTELEQATTLEPTNPRYHYELGRLYKLTGDSRQSNEELSRSRALYGTHSTPPNP